MDLKPSSRIKDLSGRVFERLTVLGFAGLDSRFKATWLCRCECGIEKAVGGNTLTQGRTRSCGCLQRESVSALSKTNEWTGTPERAAWVNMLSRCENPAHPSFENYGGRGISVSLDWHSFENFIRDMGYRPSDKHSIDRIENDLGYSKENCRWATRAVQNRNHRRNRWIETPLGRMLLCDAAEKSGVDAVTLRSRLRRGWPPERLFDALKINQSDAVRTS